MAKGRSFKLVESVQLMKDIAIRVLAFSSSFDPRYRNKEETNYPISPRITTPIPPRLIQGCLVLMTFSR